MIDVEDLIGIVLFGDVQSAGTAEIRDTGAGRDAGSGQGSNRFGIVDQFSALLGVAFQKASFESPKLEIL